MEEALKNFTNVFVAIDIGGTNTRVSVGSMRESHQIAKFLASSKAALLEGLARVSRELRASAPQLHIVGACAALAGPILEGGRACAVTNYLGGDKRMELSDFVATGLCPSGKLVLLNDLEATCFGLIALDHPSSHLKLEHFFETLWAPDNRKPALHVEKKFCVLAVGTGLGSAAILWNGASKTFSVIPLEAGHSVVQGYGPEHPGYQVHFLSRLSRLELNLLKG
jgi:glucokinase